MKIQLPYKKILLLIAIVLVGIVFFKHIYKEYLEGVIDWKHVEKVAIEILKREETSFLVTDSLKTKAVIEINENNIFLGERKGRLIVTVKLYYGMDLSELSSSSFEREENKLIIYLPEPKELDYSADLGSATLESERSMLVAIVDKLRGKSLDKELLEKLHDTAINSLRNEDLIPSKAQIISRLGSLSSMISDQTGVETEFR